ncbi:hypothetical protein N6L26_09150 [Qipengyuania sp. SS22]|uniref:hypothetical protein n=1 Tax=Qipengyuania sp. SS22 TaxID=2979461 RepID=UPI0021E53793|nr:hypothetical protein [Qipengyuania sp. SS22]UYH54222.1 hypothetical protein N6L26_09150 [Qipengyuania sp. SS22]
MKRLIFMASAAVALSSASANGQSTCDAAAFSEADADGNGWVDQSEFAAFVMPNCGLDFGEANTLFAVSDKDMNGVLDAAEFWRAIQKLFV